MVEVARAVSDFDLAAWDPAFFVDRFCWLQPAEGGQAERFRLREYQTDGIRMMDTERWLLVLKARQLGLSWLADAFALWLCTFNSGMTVLMFSVGLREAKEELKRVKFMHSRLPDGLRRVHAKPEAMDKIEFPEMDSRILSLPSSEHGGTSYTAQLVIVQEVAKILNIEELMTSVLPTIGQNGKLIGVSTAKGFGNYFERLWKGEAPIGDEPGKKGAGVKLSDGWLPGDDDSPWTPFFVPSSAHPDRDETWVDETARAMGSARKFRQEYPETPAEAFQLTDEAPFAAYFSRETHHVSYVRAPVLEGVHPDQRWPVWRGLDFGLHVSPCYWAEVQGDKLIVFDELYATNKATDQFAKAIIENDKLLGVTTMLVNSGVDPAGGARAAQTGVPDVQILRKAGIPVAEDRLGRLSRVSPADRVGQIQYLLREGRLFVNCDRCPRLAEALERAEWKRRGLNGPFEDTYRKDGRYEHPLDALGYLVINVFPPFAPSEAATTLPVQPYGGGFDEW